MKKCGVSVKKKIINNKKKIIKGIKKVKKEIVEFFKRKHKNSKIKKMFLNINSFFIKNNIYLIILFSIPFFIMDFATRLWATDVSIYPLWKFPPRVFSLSYIILLIGLTFSVKKNNKILYCASYLIFLILFLVNGVYYSATSNFFDFSMLELAGEGSSYFIDVIVNCNVWVYVIFVLLIALFILNFKLFPKKNLYCKKAIFVVVIVFVLLHLWAKNSLGEANFELTWDTWRTPRNIYNNFNDSKKCMAICGFYEYVFRDIYITYIKPEEKRSETGKRERGNGLPSIYEQFVNKINLHFIHI